ncbi:MAG TPA: protease inhibitor I9 family protein, partial [Candidatus Limnocylindrales bacterium]|nr:protease inhibitor I9 family protein [Candidatus Limnocylindrales bacterium]
MERRHVITARRALPAALILLVASSSVATATEPVAAPPAVETSAQVTASDGGLSAEGRYIVVLRGRASGDVAGAAGSAAALGRRHGFQPDHVFSRAMRGFSAVLPDAVRQRLERDPDVQAIVPDELVELTWVRPTGIRRVNAPASPITDIDGIDDA